MLPLSSLPQFLFAAILWGGTFAAQADDPNASKDPGEGHPPLFDMPSIRDASTLDVNVIVDWHEVPGPVATRQKLIDIHIGNMWPGQAYRMPVRLVVPATGKAKGFHLTGGSNPDRIRKDIRVNGTDRDLIEGGVGVVHTVVQVLQASGLRELAQESEKRFAQTLDARVKIQYWAWPATLMRAITAAYAEDAHFEPGKVLGSGGSKNGATPSLAIIHDERITAVHASVSPIWESPLRLADADVWKDYAPGQNAFLGGHYGPSYHKAALASGKSWDDLRDFANRLAPSTFVSLNHERLVERGCEFLFHPGTHDFVCYDLAWGGEHYPDIPLYLGPNTGHGKRGRHPRSFRESNKRAFILRHFFPDDIGPLPPIPSLKIVREGTTLAVDAVVEKRRVHLRTEGANLFWMVDRPDDGTPGYLNKMIGDKDWIPMRLDANGRRFTNTFEIPADAKRIDVFANVRATLEYKGRPMQVVISSPYTRIDLSK